MTIRHLRVFVSVAETCNMHESAKQLYIAQPAVSRTISELESCYNVRLFERLSKKLYLTDTGNEFLYYARHVLSVFSDLEQQMSHTTAYTKLKIGATITIGTCLMNTILDEFKSCYPESETQISINIPDVLAASLLNNELDIALVESMPITADLVFEPFLDDKMILVTSPKHEFAQKKRVTLDEISRENYIAREQGTVQELFLQFMEIHGKPVKCAWFCNNSETTKLAVTNNHGVTVISKRIVANEINNGTLVEVEFEGGPITRKFHMIYHKNKFFSPALTDFKDICHKLDLTQKC